MLIRSLTTVLCALLALATTLAPAQATRPAADNAASVYLRHWNLLDMSALQFALLELKPGEIGDERWPAPDALPYEADTLDALAAGIMQAANIERCDFGWDRSRGPGTELPHLGNLRASGRLMAVLARRQIDAGTPASAVPYLDAGYRIAAHCAQDKLTVSSSYAMSVFETVDAVTRLMLTKTALEDADRARLVAALKTNNPADPFYGAASVKGEADIMAAWMEGKVATGQSNEVIEHVRGALAGAGRVRIQTDPVIDQTANLENLDRALLDADGYIDRIVRHWNDANPLELQDAIAQFIKSGIVIPIVPETVRDFYGPWSAGRDLFAARLHALSAK